MSENPYYLKPPRWYILQQMRSENSLSTDTNHKHFSLEFAKEISKTVKTILDLGCSDGWLLEQFKNMGFEATGITISKRDYEVAKSRGLNVKVADMHNLPCENESFDLVWMRNVLEHSLNPKTVMWEIKRVLKPEGCLFLVYPSMIWKGSDHYSLMEEDKVVELIKEVGLKVESVKRRDTEKIEASEVMSANYEIRIIARK